MNSKLKIVLVAAVVIGSATACRPAHVQGGGYYPGPAVSGTSGIWHSDIRSRIERARAWIDRSEAQGRLTRLEVHGLRTDLNGIVEQMHAYQNDDNRVSQRDRDTIHTMLSRLERSIYKESYDDQYRRR